MVAKLVVYIIYKINGRKCMIFILTELPNPYPSTYYYIYYKDKNMKTGHRRYYFNMYKWLHPYCVQKKKRKQINRIACNSFYKYFRVFSIKNLFACESKQLNCIMYGLYFYIRISITER
jgi:hypothetical protein